MSKKNTNTKRSGYFVRITDPETGEFELLDGALAQLYPDTDFGSLPELTAEQYRQWCQRGSQIAVYQNGKLTFRQPETDVAAQFQAAQAEWFAQLNRTAQNIVNQAADIGKLLEFEVQSWALQAIEAKAWAQDKTVATPVLDKIAAARGVPADALKQAALRKTLQYEALTAFIAGQRQALQTRIEAAKTLEDLNAIEIIFRLPESE